VWMEIYMWDICVKCICEFYKWKIIAFELVNGNMYVKYMCESICEEYMWKIIVRQRVNGNMYLKYMCEMYLRDTYVKNNCTSMCEWKYICEINVWNVFANSMWKIIVVNLWMETLIWKIYVWNAFGGYIREK